MNALRLMDAAPVEVVLLGVQPESTDWGTALTSRVDAAQKELLEVAMAQLARWAEDFSGRRFALAGLPSKPQAHLSPKSVTTITGPPVRAVLDLAMFFTSLGICYKLWATW